MTFDTLEAAHKKKAVEAKCQFSRLHFYRFSVQIGRSRCGAKPGLRDTIWCLKKGFETEGRKTKDVELV